MGTSAKVAFTETPACRLLVSRFRAARQAFFWENRGGETADFSKNFNFKKSKTTGGEVAAAVRQWLVERTCAGEPNRPVVRLPETWRLPARATERELMTDFVRHVFVRYEVPRWFYEVWQTADGGESELHRNWFVAVAQGKNLSAVAGLPFRMTKKTAHHSLHAPAHFSLVQAFRWGQVLGLPGGGERLAAAVARSFLGKNFLPEEENFWLDQMSELVKNYGQFDLSEVAPILNFVRRTRSEATLLHGRPEILRAGKFDLCCVEDWKKFAAQVRTARFPEPEPTDPVEAAGIYRAGCHTRRQRKRYHDRIWSHFRRLTTRDEFEQEGYDMRHCVAGYFEKSRLGQCTIWSVQPRRAGRCDVSRRLTIEVVEKKLVQVRGFRNRDLTVREREQVRLWARGRGFEF